MFYIMDNVPIRSLRMSLDPLLLNKLRFLYCYILHWYHLTVGLTLYYPVWMLTRYLRSPLLSTLHHDSLTRLAIPGLLLLVLTTLISGLYHSHPHMSTWSLYLTLYHGHVSQSWSQLHCSDGTLLCSLLSWHQSEPDWSLTLLHLSLHLGHWLSNTRFDYIVLLCYWLTRYNLSYHHWPLLLHLLELLWWSLLLLHVLLLVYHLRHRLLRLWYRLLSNCLDYYRLSRLYGMLSNCRPLSDLTL